ncbi:hypothetical protein JCM19275_3700 [Nonlabens ulvanivorans]|uniref:Lipid/polyisoprenoid-binding YceI-like domain-containing protein n=1 Tax=Nonlabens ulvanivorans TaxID=906888 RepID=A0A090WJ38_NONUL|nr:YceI family protein [Nonlabens ulvanivorans]GAL76986.1 hypothetical protein JCM19275_3700 [Nonlabens ulvanivorans]
MKIIYLAFLALVSISSISSTQTDRYQTRTGSISFEASVPTFEPIRAVNKSTTVVLDMKTGNIAALALVKGFRFPIALMQEHFNENYIESDDYPKAVLKGTLSNFDAHGFSQNTSTTFILNGTLELHGQKKMISIPVLLSQSGENIQLESNFNLKPADFNIEIPSVVSNKIAQEVQISVKAILNKK